MRSNITAATRSIDHAKGFNHKWVTGLIMAAVLILGWEYPRWGFVVPVAMGAGILGGFFRGRWVCGNLCPRGSFLDTWFSLVSAKKEIPALLSGKKFRWSTLTMLMSFMVFRLAQNPGEVDHWGLVFWQMCLITTIAAFALGLRYSARSWCAFCPVGTIAGSIGGEKYPLQVHSSCKACALCEKSCPMQLSIPQYRQSGSLQEKDCIKCSECIKTCPRKEVLKWPVKRAA